MVLEGDRDLLEKLFDTAIKTMQAVPEVNSTLSVTQLDAHHFIVQV